MSRRGSHGGEHFVHPTFQCISSTKSQCILCIFIVHCVLTVTTWMYMYIRNFFKQTSLSTYILCTVMICLYEVRTYQFKSCGVF